MSRFDELLGRLQQYVGGDLGENLPISDAHDELDAVAHAINVVVGELRLTIEHLRQARDEAEAANRAKTRFLRNISHEIRTPLSAMSSMVELLRAAELPADRREELLSRVASNARALQTLVDDLLDLSKMEAGKLVVELRPIHATLVIADVVADLQPEADRKGLRLTVDAVGDGPVLVDRRRLRQILTNLVANAIKFTPKGSVRIVLAEAGPSVIIDVEDTGIGMTPDQSPSLFDSFVQADPSIAPRFGGSGLGLALSRRLARVMKGEVTLVASAPTKGSTFRLALPRTNRPVSSPKKDAKPLVRLDGARLLFAEDHDDIRLSLGELLRLRGAIVKGVADGQAAVDEAAPGRYDAVVMDVRMPVLDGLEATRRLRERGITVPIVALTGDAVPQHRVECLVAGCSAYVAKPVDFEQLIVVLRDLLHLG